MERTVNRLFRDSAERFPDNPMMWEKSGGAFKPTDYRTALRLVEETAAGLIHLGLGKGDRVTLMSEGRNDWVFSELGILFAGGVDVPLSIKLQEPAEIRFRILHSGSKFVIVSGRQLPKILPLRKDLPELEKIIVLDEDTVREEAIITMGNVRLKGRALLEKEPGRLSERERSVTENDPANICYTSGTTADPKGIVLTHRNYTANVEQARAFFELPAHFVLPSHPSLGSLLRPHLRCVRAHFRRREHGVRGNGGNRDRDHAEHRKEHQGDTTHAPVERSRSVRQFQEQHRAPDRGQGKIRLRPCEAGSAECLCLSRRRLCQRPLAGEFPAKAAARILRPNSFFENPRGIRRPLDVFRGRRRPARHRVPAVFRGNRDSRIPGIRARGSRARDFGQPARSHENGNIRPNPAEP